MHAVGHASAVCKVKLGWIFFLLVTIQLSCACTKRILPTREGPRDTGNKTLIRHFTVSSDLAFLNTVFRSQAISPLN